MSQSEQDKTAVEPANDQPVVDEGEVLAWTVHPVKRKPWVSILVTMLIAAVGASVHSMMQSMLFTVLAMVILLASLAKFYFPTNYKISDLGVTVKTTTQTLFKEWKIYRSCYADKKGLLLSPFVAPTRLENFRGLYLMFEGNGDQVTAFARERIRRAHRPSTETKNDTGGEA